jgi:hypothetical protein
VSDPDWPAIITGSLVILLAVGIVAFALWSSRK